MLLSSDAKTMEEALLLSNGKETVKDLLTAKTAKIGEKLSFRRFEIITKMMMRYLGLILIWVERLVQLLY